MVEPISIRRLAPTDSTADLTCLLHRAYAGLAARGFRYHATWQDEATTRKRCAKGECYVAVLGRCVIGTITLVDADKTRGSPWYDRPDVACFVQFGVEPHLQRQRIGTRMLDFVEHRAAEKGVNELACDTAEGAAHLIDWYTSRGYRFVEHVQWAITNYRSVILSKTLERPGAVDAMSGSLPPVRSMP